MGRPRSVRIKYATAATLAYTLAATILFSGCNFESAEPTPTAEENTPAPIEPLPQIASPSPSLSPTLTASTSPTGAVISIDQIATAAQTETPLPTASETASATPGPWEYTIETGDTLGFIIQKPPFNYRTLDVIQEIVRINPNILSADSLPGPGAVILIPRPTATPIPVGAELTQEFAATIGTSQIGVPDWTIIGPHTIRDGETVVGIVEEYAGLTLEIFARLNPDVNFIGCNFEAQGGGPNCNPLIREGQDVNVILPTPTLTTTPTPSDDEPPTPTPPAAAPQLVSPTEGSIAAGSVGLHWVSVGFLSEEAVYLVQVMNQTTGENRAFVTRSASVRLPADFQPPAGEVHEFTWFVSVAVQDAGGAYTPHRPAQRSQRIQVARKPVT